MHYVNLTDKDGNDALIHAAAGNHYDIVKYLIGWKKCTDCQRVPLMDAASPMRSCEGCSKTLVCQNCLTRYNFEKSPGRITCFYDSYCNGCMMNEYVKCKEDVKCIKFRDGSFNAINHLNKHGESFWIHLMQPPISDEAPLKVDPNQIKVNTNFCSFYSIFSYVNQMVFSSHFNILVHLRCF